MFHAYTNALDLIRALVPVVEQLKTYDANLADQVVRAATSISLNVAEGSGRSGKDRLHCYRVARGRWRRGCAWRWPGATSRSGRSRGRSAS